MNLKTRNALVSLAGALYPAAGKSSNDWGHISAVVAQGSAMTTQVKGRELNKAELAALLLHDVAVAPFGGEKKHHAERSGICAYMMLSSSGLFTEEEARAVGLAISLHDEKELEKETSLADLLAAADFSPMDIVYIVGKSYGKNLKQVKCPLTAAVKTAAYVSKAYGSKSKRLFPRIYQRYYGEQIPETAAVADTLTPAQVLEFAAEFARRPKPPCLEIPA